MGPNSSKWFKIAPNGQTDQWLSKIVQNGTKLSKKVKIVQSGLLWTNMVQKDPKWLEIVPHGPK